MVCYTLQDYWTFVRAHRRGNKNALNCLELLAHGEGLSGALARRFLDSIETPTGT